MKLKYMLATGAILFSCTASAQTSAGIAAYNSSPPIQCTSIHGIFLPNAEYVKSERRAAERGDASAQFRLAVMYYYGQGVPQDYTEAANWFRKAAQLGDAVAQKNLGVMYGKGEGVPQSHAEAFIWTSISAKSGDSGAVDIRNFAGGNLSVEELDTAENRISQLYENIKLREIHN